MRRWANESGAGSVPCRTAQRSNGASSFEQYPLACDGKRSAGAASDPSLLLVGRIPVDDGNLQEQPNPEERPDTTKVRAAIGTTGDVLMIDATATIATVADIADIAEVAGRYARATGNDPQSVDGFVYIQLVPSGSSYGRAPWTSPSGR